MTRLQFLSTSLAVFMSVAALNAAEIAFQPFKIDHQTREDSPIDVSFLLGTTPAGQDGFITMKGGHLVKPNGERFRIWGVNLTGWTRGSTLLPPKDEAARWAQIMARHGINCVRFHFLDLPTRSAAEEAALDPERNKAEAEGQRFKTRPAGLIDSTKPTTEEFDADALDRLDYFVNELKKVGIYSNLNLNVGRGYKPGDNVPESDRITLWKGLTYIGERLIELQRSYAHKLLTHYNPYTKTEYRNEPAIATVEIVNENSLYEFWMRNWLRGEFQPGDDAGPTRFSALVCPPAGRTLSSLARQASHARRNRGAASSRRASRQGAPVPRLRRGEFSIASKERFHAEADFLGDIELEFLDGMYKYLKKISG